jgi:myosin-7
MASVVELGINTEEVAAANKLIKELQTSSGNSKKSNDQLAQATKKRDEQMASADKKLTEAISTGNFDKVNAALNDAMQLGLATATVQKAQTFLSAKGSKDDIKNQLEASIKVLKVKAEAGIKESDLIPLRNAITRARQLNLPELSKELAEAEEAHILYQKHATAAVGLEAAVKAKDRIQLRKALDEAENLDLQIEIVNQAKEILRELEMVHRAKLASGEITQTNEPYDAAEEARKARQEVAKQARFDVKNFPNLRTADDFARGAIFNKAKVKEQFLVFQNTVIPKSLLDLNKDNNKLAMQIHKDLLGYMGDKQMPFPAMLAQDILRKGYEYKPIRDEIYMLIIKQLTSNPRPESVAKGWQIMCMCVGTFPPSFDFENFLLHYIIEKRDRGRGAVVDYARYCLRTLEAMLSNGDGTGFVPSVEEILAYKERPPILATIHLVDGNVITEDLPITPDLNVGKVLEMCSGWLDLKDSRVDSLGMFVYDLGETDDAATMDDSYKNAPYRDLIRTPRPLRNDDFMGDIIVQRARQRRKFKFVIKKKIFLPQHNGRGSDPFYERLVYLQAEDETIIQGE